MGYNVDCFYQDSARRASPIAAQGGINAAKNYPPSDNDSIYRHDARLKGGILAPTRGQRHRLAEVSASIIDQCVARAFPSPVVRWSHLDSALRWCPGVPVRSTRVAEQVSSS